MTNVKELAKVFSPQEAVTVLLNGQDIFEGQFQAAVPMLKVLVLREGDHLIITSEVDDPMPAPWLAPPADAG